MADEAQVMDRAAARFIFQRGDVLILALVLLAGLKFTFQLENALDIGLYDESDYLYRGVKLATIGFAQADWGPLYSLWYYLLSFVQPDRVALYYLNYKLMIIVPPVLLCLLLRRYHVSLLPSLLVSWFLLVSKGHAYTWPKVSHFGVIIVLATLIVIGRTGSPLWSALLASAGALLVAYVRPEFALTFGLALLLFGLLLAWGYRKVAKRQLGMALAAYGVVFVLLVVVLGSPVMGDRSIGAFGQHFARNWVNWTGSDLNPWTNWRTIVADQFGPAESVSEALVNNPAVFLRHLAYNVGELVRIGSTLVFPTIAPADTFSKVVAGSLLAGLVMARRITIRQTFAANRWLVVVAALFVLPGLVSALLIFPRDHYLLLPGMMAAVVLAVLMDKRTNEPSPFWRLVLPGLLLVALTPYFTSHLETERPNLATIRFIESLGIEEPVNLLEVEGGYHIYLGDQFSRVGEVEKDEAFDLFLTNHEVNMIVLSNSLANDVRFRDDAEWQRFLTAYADQGFALLDIPDTDRKLIVRNDLLEESVSLWGKSKTPQVAENLRG
jgi:hypothetical protein